MPLDASDQLDAIVVGGSFAGLAAATYLARARRRVRVIDAGKPRNRFAEKSHGFLGHDGSDPRTILAAARTQVAAYPTVEIVEGEAVEARADGAGFSVGLAGGETLQASRLVLAFGLTDGLPPLPGLAERWGKTVLHCPYCHGFEFADERLGVLYTMPNSIHGAMLIAEWGPTTLYLDGQAVLDAESEAELVRRGVAIERDPLAGLEGEGAGLSHVRFADGRRRAIDALFVAPRSTLTSPLAAQLGCAIDEGPMGPVVRTDGEKRTTVPGVYAAGDIARAPHSVSWAVADGVMAGVAAHRSLVFG
ncbi:NAD(P)/FAD-dependent oxidoreductase [Sphingomonas cannabina]|uniref:NAD(P)/FAD-dependent oxidoreductase n=1 Tax=Sphingomonas cannabina TaxID=2899123 RepID=UPI001F3A6C5D|nr:NAD(P)/FAD-dependent oxidoreductase [Sphingomonas cannabina]UIJ46731.1 NAD(P)/FAD-dependent oxidoreductase [Sphingomonas cannabina]